MQCTQCGHALSAAELAGADCPYCGTVLPHRARAAEKAAVVEQMLADRDGNGVPDVFEALAPGLGPPPPGAFTTYEVHTSNVVIVNGQVQQDGRIPDDIARHLAAAGFPVPQAAVAPAAPAPPPAAPPPVHVASPARAEAPAPNARFVAVAVGAVVALAVALLLALLSRG